MSSPAVFIDLGGPLICDSTADGYDPLPLQLLQAEGLRVTPRQLREARRAAVSSFAGSCVGAALWRLTRPDLQLYARLRQRLTEHWRSLPPSPLRKGAREMLAQLTAAGYSLHLATRYSAARQAELLGLHGLEAWLQPTPDPPLHKPDPRYYVWLRERLEPAAGFHVMVGDRLDCDIVPAKAAGFRTVRLRVGDHASQEPRVPEEAPDWDLPDLESVTRALTGLDREPGIP